LDDMLRRLRNQRFTIIIIMIIINTLNDF